MKIGLVKLVLVTSIYQCFQLLNVQKNTMKQFEEFRSALWLQFCKQRRLVWIQEA